MFNVAAGHSAFNIQHSTFNIRLLMKKSLCSVAPHPELQQRMLAALASMRESADPALAPLLTLRTPRVPGLDDGLIVPADELGVESAAKMVQAAAVRPRPLRGE